MMKPLLERSSRFLDRPVGVGPRLLLVLSAALLLPAYLLPLWQVRLAFAPPRQVTVDVYAQRWVVAGIPAAPEGEEGLEGSAPGELEPQTAGLNWFPFALGALGLLALRAAVVGKTGSVLDVAVLGAYFLVFALWSFGRQAVNYGINIFPGGELSVAPIEGPLFGSTELDGLRIDSRPGPGTFVFLGVVALLVIALLLSWRQGRRDERSEAGIGP
jgi:hypothetical protein